MKSLTTGTTNKPDKYLTYIICIVVVAVLLITAIWVWYVYESKQIEEEIYKLNSPSKI